MDFAVVQDENFYMSGEAVTPTFVGIAEGRGLAYNVGVNRNLWSAHE